MRRRRLCRILFLLATAGCVRARAPQPAETAPLRDVTVVVDAEVTGIPPDAKELRLWIPVPRDEGAQVLTRMIPETPGNAVLVTDTRRGNGALLVVLATPASSASARVTFEVSRAEQRGASASHPLSHVEKREEPDASGADEIPTRRRNGFLLPADETEGTLTIPDAWFESWNPDRGWTPGNGGLDRHRIGISLGVDLVFEGQQGPPLGAFVFPYAEVDGQPIPVSSTVTFHDR